MIRKVQAFIVRKYQGRNQLLIFRHSITGIRELVRGTVEKNERPIDAVFREVEEESGLVDIEVQAYLGKKIYQIRSGPERKGPFQDQEHHAFVVVANSEDRDSWIQVATGSPEEEGLKLDFYWHDLNESINDFLFDDFRPFLDDLIKSSFVIDRKSFSFSSMQISDFDIYYQWRKTEYVSRWWGSLKDYESEKRDFLSKLNSGNSSHYLCLMNSIPIGYIQYYFANKVGNNWWPNENEGTLGFDLFIGEESFVNKKLGKLIVADFINFLKCEHPNVSKIICDPHPSNDRAIKCFEKAGFKNNGMIQTPDGDAILLEYIVGGEL